MKDIDAPEIWLFSDRRTISDCLAVTFRTHGLVLRTSGRPSGRPAADAMDGAIAVLMFEDEYCPETHGPWLSSLKPATPLPLILLTSDPTETQPSSRSCPTRHVDEQSPLEELITTIRRVVGLQAGSSTTDDPSSIDHLLPAPATCRARLNRLTNREREVLAALMMGASASDVAAEACIAISTVRSHIRSLIGKLEVNSQTAAVAVGYRGGGHPRALP